MISRGNLFRANYALGFWGPLPKSLSSDLTLTAGRGKPQDAPPAMLQGYGILVMGGRRSILHTYRHIPQWNGVVCLRNQLFTRLDYGICFLAPSLPEFRHTR